LISVNKETPNQFDKSATDSWFDIISLGKKGDLENSDIPVIPEKMTWAICQISLGYLLFILLVFIGGAPLLCVTQNMIHYPPGTGFDFSSEF
jgi:hypothetical protein